MNFTFHFHQVLKFRTLGATRSLPHTPSWHAQEHLHHYRSKFYDYIIIVLIVIVIIIIVMAIIITTIILINSQERN